MTMVEIIIVTAVLSIVLAGAFAMITRGTQSASDIEERMNLEIDARPVIDVLVRDLRQADSGDKATTAIITMTATTLTFYSPERLNAYGAYHMRQVSYRLTGTTLERAVSLSTDTDGWPWTGFPALSLQQGAGGRPEHEHLHVQGCE